MQNLQKILLVSIGLIVAIAAMIAAGLFFVAPQMASDAVHSRVERLEKRMGLTIEVGTIETEGLGGVRIQDVTVATEGNEPFLAVEDVAAQADVGALLTGEKKVSSIQVAGVHFTLEIDENGGLALLDQIRGERDGKPESGESVGRSTSLLERLPDVEATDVTIDIVVAKGGPRVPISKIEMPTASIENSSGLELAATMKLTETGDIPGASIPSTLETRFRFDEKLAPISGEASFDGQLAITGLPPLPWVRLGTSGFGIDDAGRLYMDDVSLGVHGSEERRLVDIKRFAAKPNTLDIRRLDEFKLLDVVLKGARVYLKRDERGAFAFGDVRNLLAPAAPATIASSARRFATRLAEKHQVPEPEVEDEEQETRLEVAPDKNGWAKHIERWAPNRVDVEDFEIVGEFPDPPEVLQPATSFSMKNGRLELEHDPEKGVIALEGGFDAFAGGEARGTARADLELGYRQLNLEGSTKLDAIDISWLGLVVGDRLARLVPGGVLRADLKFEPTGQQAFKATGMASFEGLEVRSDALALEPIRDMNASYTFSARFDAHMNPAEARLLKDPLYDPDDFGADENPDAELPPAPVGGLVFDSGSFTFNGASGVFRPAFYGFNAPEGRPARMDITFEIPRTPVMDLFDAVPSAIQGPARGTQMRGEFEYKLHVEVPLYRAKDMVWESLPILHEFEVIDIPEAADVRRMMNDSMKVTITDSIEEEDDFERTITLGPPRPMPATWLMKNSGLTLEEIDERRRKRERPELPDPFTTAISQRMIDRPEIWLTPWALSKAAPRPWTDDDTIQPTDERPYGPYVFVPLNHISHYMPLAVMTTEDNSFFVHKGFNWLALRASIERNIEAGGFARGASTIAMQMVKNAFLHRKKVLSRKIQEAFLVFLMESAIDVPKARIMEVYLNIIEFGPGIFGIHDAAVHYFGKRPDELTLGEVAWFVSIIPNPKKYHFYYERGAISPRWFARMKRYIQVMHNRERITAEELAEATIEPPEFYKPNLDEGEPLLKPRVEEPPALFAPINLLGEPDEPTPDPQVPSPVPQPTPLPDRNPASPMD